MTTDALFETPAAGVAPVASAAGTIPAPAVAPVAAGAGKPVAAPAPGAATVEDGRARVSQGEGDATARPLLEIHVIGLPAPQGSKRAIVNPHTGKPAVIESAAKSLGPWRQDVKQAALDALRAHPGYEPPADGVGVVLDVTFMLPRPRGHYRTGRNAHLLRDSAPRRPTTKPDTDKLLRSTMDALKVAGVYRDDSHAVTITGRKVYAPLHAHTGALIYVYTGGEA